APAELHDQPGAELVLVLPRADVLNVHRALLRAIQTAVDGDAHAPQPDRQPRRAPLLGVALLGEPEVRGEVELLVEREERAVAEEHEALERRGDARRVVPLLRRVA